jgi:hypothetical protein
MSNREERQLQRNTMKTGVGSQWSVARSPWPVLSRRFVPAILALLMPALARAQYSIDWSSIDAGVGTSPDSHAWDPT